MKTSRWLPLAVFFVLAALLAAGVWMSRSPDRDALPSPLIGKPAPAFELPVLHDPKHTARLTDLRGQPFVLNVWGSWCVSCRVEHPIITDLAKSGAIVVGYNYKDTPEDAGRWLAQFGNPFALILQDTDGRAALDWGIYGAPETFVIDADGIVRFKHVGPLTTEIVNEKILPLLKESP